MKFEIKDYKGHKYLEYYDEKENKKFSNAKYFIFDTICDEFKAIMADTGGFVAEMTTRTIKKLNIPCESIMLCCTPHHNNTFQFQFVYLDEDRNVLNVEWDNNPYDYEYFKKKFSSCIIEEGCIFDLLKYDYLKEVTKEFKTPTVNFDIKIDNKEITVDDILICEDLCFLKEEYAENFKNFGVTYAELTYDFHCMSPSNFKVQFVKDDGSYLKNYEAIERCKTWEEYQEKYADNDDFYKEAFYEFLEISVIRQLTDHFEYKSKEREDIERDE